MGRRNGKKKNNSPRDKRAREPKSQGQLPEFSGAAWASEDGVHTLLPGTPPDPETLQRMTRIYQEQIRNSPLWDEMVREFGAQKAGELLKQCRAELR